VTRVPLILLGKGSSSVRRDELLASHPEAEIWCINGTHCDRAQLQFEIHHPEPLSHLMPAVPVVVSPFAARAGDRIPFPLEQACRRGRPYFESTVDYMLAHALLEHEEAAMGRFSRVILCGIDLATSSHWRYRAGASYWCGVLDGARLPVEVQPESSLLKRRVAPNTRELDPLHPHLYGQPAALSAPWLRAHGYEVAA
jgi:hypothetical protein